MFVSGWIANFGTPTISTDWGYEFESVLWSELASLLGSKRTRTTSYYLITNALVERFHRQVKVSLKDPTCWTESLPLVIRTAYKHDVKCTAAELVYGTTLQITGEFFAPSDGSIKQPPVDDTTYVSRLKETMQSLAAISPRHPPHRCTYVSEACSHVFGQV